VRARGCVRSRRAALCAQSFVRRRPKAGLYVRLFSRGQVASRGGYAAPDNSREISDTILEKSGDFALACTASEM
jgi:hypothetical protein